MHRPGVELAIFRSQVRRPNHYTTEPPWLLGDIRPWQHMMCGIILLAGCGRRIGITWIVVSRDPARQRSTSVKPAPTPSPTRLSRYTFPDTRRLSISPYRH